MSFKQTHCVLISSSSPIHIFLRGHSIGDSLRVYLVDGV